MKYLEGLPREEIDKTTHLNAMRNFSYSPFDHIPRGRCAVGALRAQAGDVDTSLVAYGTGKIQDDGIAATVTLAERLAARR